MNNCLQRDALLKPKITTEWVPLPQWGEDAGVYVRTLRAKDKDLFEESQVNADERNRLKNFRARFVALTACDEKGDRLFSDVDADALGEQDAETLAVIFNAARKLSRMLLSEAEREGLEKNLPVAPPVA